MEAMVCGTLYQVPQGVPRAPRGLEARVPQVGFSTSSLALWQLARQRVPISAISVIVQQEARWAMRLAMQSARL